MEPIETYVASLDVGTTTIRCVIINSKTQIVGSSRTTVKLLYPKPGFVEIDPNELWNQIVDVITMAIKNAQLESKDIKCLGISTQRATFLTWDRKTGKSFHNFITWKDTRAKHLCKELNNSLFLKVFRYSAYGLYAVTRNERYLTGSRLKIASNHITGRLLWVISNIPTLKAALSERQVMFGTVDTWLLYKFSKGQLHLTDISNASATAFYDPFVKEWGTWSKVLGIPNEILPKVVANDFDFGTIAEDIFGFPIPIKCVLADQSSSMFASCSFNCDDIKITLGTGAFLDVNTADKIHTSVTGIYPLIAWQIKNDVVFIGEVACNDCGSFVEWLLNMGLITNPADTDDIVNEIPDSGGVYFIPAFSGLGPPINDDRAGSGFLGVQPTTRKNHLVRAVVEGIVYRITLAFQTLKQERPRNYKKLIVDGGVSNNDFICQMLADLTGTTIERLNSTEMSVLGVGLLAGISAGVWKNSKQIQELRKVDKSFSPSTDQDCLTKRILEFNRWLDAVARFKLWYNED